MSTGKDNAWEKRLANTNTLLTCHMASEVILNCVTPSMAKTSIMQAIQIEIPQDVILALKIPQQRIKVTLTEELAIYLYAQGYLSFGKARKLANLTKWEFAERLGGARQTSDTTHLGFLYNTTLPL